MSESLQYVRKNRGQVARDVSELLSSDDTKEVRIVHETTGICVYATFTDGV